jgi:hypothetical protein
MPICGAQPLPLLVPLQNTTHLLQSLASQTRGPGLAMGGGTGRAPDLVSALVGWLWDARRLHLAEVVDPVGERLASNIGGHRSPQEESGSKPAWSSDLLEVPSAGGSHHPDTSAERDGEEL